MKDFLYGVIAGKVRGGIATFLLCVLVPLSYLYALVVIVRGWFYDYGWLKQKQLPCKVISVGNIAAGGTGKTPAVIWIAKVLQDTGCQIAILLRGYNRQKRTSPTQIVSDGQKILVSVEASGDEASMIARELPSVPVVVGKDRYAAGHQILERWNIDVLILDDGFQHRSLARDLDIVTVDATQPFGTERLLPAGTLREPVSALRRADVVLLTRIDLVQSPILAHKKIEWWVGGKPILHSCHRPVKLYQLGVCEVLDFSVLKGKRLFAVCSVGNPAAFVETLNYYEPESVVLFPFPDHHRYTQTDFTRIRDSARQAGTDLIITTSKDEPKMLPFVSAKDSTSSIVEELSVYVLAVELSITVGKNVLVQRIQECKFRHLETEMS